MHLPNRLEVRSRAVVHTLTQQQLKIILTHSIVFDMQGLNQKTIHVITNQWCELLPIFCLLNSATFVATYSRG